MTRSELYAAIWAQSISKVAKELRLSDTWLRKVCLANDVPMPPRGYLQRVAAKHHVPPPPALQGEDRTVEFRGRSRTGKFARQDRPSRAPSVSSATLATRARAATSSSPSSKVADQRPPSRTPSVSAAAATTTQADAAKKLSPFGEPPEHLELEMQLLARDADEFLQHRAKEELLSHMAAMLAAAPELKPQDWWDWLRGLRAEVQQHEPRRELEAWAMRRLGAEKRSSR